VLLRRLEAVHVRALIRRAVLRRRDLRRGHGALHLRRHQLRVEGVGGLGGRDLRGQEGLDGMLLLLRLVIVHRWLDVLILGLEAGAEQLVIGGRRHRRRVGFFGARVLWRSAIAAEAVLLVRVRQTCYRPYRLPELDARAARQIA